MSKIGKGALGLLLKTGQTTQYGGYLDDGYYEKGLSKLYSILTVGRFSGTTNITLGDHTEAHSNNCVYDRRTKKMWSRYALVDTLGPLHDGKLPWTTSLGEGIFAYCAAANVALLGGYGDWRVPNDIELVNLRDMEAPNAVPDALAFPSWPTSDWFWSSTTRPAAVEHAVTVYFADGNVYPAGKTTCFFVALVRGG